MCGIFGILQVYIFEVGEVSVGREIRMLFNDQNLAIEEYVSSISRSGIWNIWVMSDSDGLNGF